MEFAGNVTKILTDLGIELKQLVYVYRYAPAAAISLTETQALCRRRENVDAILIRQARLPMRQS